MEDQEDDLKIVAHFVNKHGEPHTVMSDGRGNFYWECQATDEHDAEMDGPYDTIEDAKADALRRW